MRQMAQMGMYMYLAQVLLRPYIYLSVFDYEYSTLKTIKICVGLYELRM